MDVDRAVVALAAGQERVVSRSQLLDAGLSRRAIARRVERGWLHRQHHGVYSVGTPNLTRRGRWMAAVLAAGPGAVLSHRDAAALWGILPSNRRLIEVSVPGRRRPREGLEIRSAILPPDETTTLDGIPVTTVARTLLDLAAVESQDRLERALSEAERRGLADHTPLIELFERHPHAKGIAALKGLAPDTTVTRSQFERDFLAFCARHRIPRPQMNVALHGFTVDAHWPHADLVAELDGYDFHNGRVPFERDRARDRALLVAGIRTTRVTWREMTRRPKQLATDLHALTRGDSRLARGR